MPHRTAARTRAALVVTVVAALLGAAFAGPAPAVADPVGATPASPVTPNAQSQPVDTGVDLPYDAVDGSYRPADPVRLLDTRSGGGPIGPNGYDSVDVTGHAGIPVGSVAAVVVNVTVVSPTAAGYLTLFATTDTEPHVSDLNFVRGQTVANLVVVDVNDTGALAVHNVSGGSTHVLVDAVGYFLGGTPSSPGTFGRVGAVRALDTRTGTGAPRAAVAAGRSIRVKVAGFALTDAAVRAVALNVTVTAPTGAGYVTTWPDGSPRPTASSVNFTRTQTVANLVVVPVGADGYVDLYNGSAGTVQLVADVRGYFLRGTPSANGTLDPVAPQRVLDTRNGTGAPRAAVAAGATLRLTVAGHHDLPDQAPSAVLNLTVTGATRDGYLTASSDTFNRPTVSNLNFVHGRTIANLVVVPVGEDGIVDLYNGSGGTVQLVADLTGTVLGQDRSVVDAQPAGGTVVATAGQVVSSTAGTDGSTTVTLAAGLTPPAVGAGLVAPESDALPAGVTGVATSVTRNGDGTSTVVTTPVSLDRLYPDLDVSVNRSLLASDVVGAPAAPPGTPASSADWFADTADFTCTGSDPSRTISIAADLSKLHVDVALDARLGSVHAQISGHPLLVVDDTFATATRCVLAAGDGSSPLALHIPVTTTPPVYLDASPTMTIAPGGAATMAWRWTPHFAVGVDRGNGHDSDTRDLSGGAAATATGSATIDVGLATSLAVAGRTAFTGTLGPSVTVTDRGLGCSALAAALTTSFTSTAGVLFPAAARPASGRSAAVYLRGCDWDEFPVLIAPGRLGNARTGDPAASVSKEVGVPLRTAGRTGCQDLETTDNRSDVAAYLDPSGTRVRLLFAERWVTAEGIRLGSTWAQVHAAYPSTQLSTVPGTGRYVTYVDAPDGTSLRIDMGFAGDLFASFASTGSKADVRAFDFCA